MGQFVACSYSTERAAVMKLALMELSIQTNRSDILSYKSQSLINLSAGAGSPVI